MTDPAPAQLPSPLWARVRILLNLGRIAEATSAAVEAAKHTNWHNDYMRIGGPRVFAHPDLPVGWCFLDPGEDMAVLNADVIDEFSQMCLFDFVRIAQLLDGPAFRWYDVANWKLLRDMADAEYEARQGDTD